MKSHSPAHPLPSRREGRRLERWKLGSWDWASWGRPCPWISSAMASRLLSGTVLCPRYSLCPSLPFASTSISLFFYFSRLMFGCFSAYGSAKRLYFDVVLYACLDASLLMVVEKDWILMLLALGKIMWCPCHAPKEVLFGEMIAVLLTVLEDWVLVECLLILIRRMQCWRVKRDSAAWGFVSVYSLLCTSYWIIEVLLAITS